MISQETLDKVDNEKWRTVVFAIAVLHSVVQERRKFGPLGWCVPYEFNSSDLEASLFAVEKHFASTILVGQPLSWPTICYMVGEVQYGGRITDDLDREVSTRALKATMTSEICLKTATAIATMSVNRQCVSIPSVFASSCLIPTRIGGLLKICLNRLSLSIIPPLVNMSSCIECLKGMRSQFSEII